MTDRPSQLPTRWCEVCRSLHPSGTTGCAIVMTRKPESQLCECGPHIKPHGYHFESCPLHEPKLAACPRCGKKTSRVGGHCSRLCEKEAGRESPLYTEHDELRASVEMLINEVGRKNTELDRLRAEVERLTADLDSLRARIEAREY